MKKTIIILSISLFFNNLYAQVKENLYAASSIPQELRKDAYAVVRQHNVRFTVSDMGSAVTEEHKIITILSEKGSYLSEANFPYDKKFNSIEDIEATIYDTDGKYVKRMKKKDIIDFMPYQEFVEDNRYKRVIFPHLPYPFTVEYKVKTAHTGLMFYPVFQPQQDNEVAVQEANFEVSMLNKEPLRYKEINLQKGVIQTAHFYKWEFNNIKAFKNEGFMPSTTYQLPIVFTAPTTFEMSGYKGDMTSWAAYGSFLNKLNEGKDELTPQTQAMIKELVADCKDDNAKIEKIYSYLQKTTRYFSIQLGIGGWQPFPATNVDKNKYGDCKALSNYMLAMLKVVGINGLHVVIRRGDDEKAQFPDFPNAYFNHAIACVPLKNDTIWLECTSQNLPCGYLNDSHDRMALLMTPEGGKIAYTPKYDENINFIKKKATIQLDTEGSAETNVEIVYSGIKQNIASELAEVNADLRKKYVYEHLKIDNATILDMDFKRQKARIPSATQTMQLTIIPLASKTGKRLFVPINVFSRFSNVPTLDSIRRFDIQADNNGFTEQDSIVLKLPEGFKSETKFTPLSIKSLFGSFDMTLTEKSPTEQVFYRKLVLNNKILPKEKYSELVDFLKNIAKADKTKLVLVQTGS